MTIGNYLLNKFNHHPFLRGVIMGIVGIPAFLQDSKLSSLLKIHHLNRDNVVI